MNVLNAATQTLPVTDEIRAEAAEVVRDAHDRVLGSVKVTMDDGQEVTLPPRLSRFLVDLVQSAAIGATLTTSSLPDELTTTVAANLLGVSRPTLMKMVARGEIPAKKVGTHTRLLRDAVFAFRRQRNADKAISVRELMEIGVDFD